jgi:hypothetical protein
MNIERETTTFNGSQLKLLIIDEIKRNIIICRHSLDLMNWLNSLQDFDNEMETVKTAKEREETAMTLLELEELINKQMRVRANKHIRTKHTPSEIIHKLDSFYKKLLRVYHDSGLEMKLEQGALGGFGK